MTDLVPDDASIFRVFGDNILETELVVEWLKNAERIEFHEQYPPSDRPIYLFSFDYYGTTKFLVHLCPGYERWPTNPLDGVFSEKPDILLTKFLENEEEHEPILAIESCDAIQAGNQSWQRFRRATDAAKAGIPYLYVVPLIDWEHESGGFELEGPRFQSAQVTLGQLTLSSLYGVPSLQVYLASDWIAHGEKENVPLPEEYETFGGISPAFSFLSSIIIDNDYGRTPSQLRDSVEKMFKNMFRVAKRYVDYQDTKLTIHCNNPGFWAKESKVAEEYADAVSEGRTVHTPFALHNITATEFIKNGTLFRKQRRVDTETFEDEIEPQINWKWSASKDYKHNFLKAWNVDIQASAAGFLNKYGVDVEPSESELETIAVSSLGEVPVSYKTPPSEAALIDNREPVRDIVEEAYAELDSTILDWIYSGNDETADSYPLFLVPMYGYKESGDSRPDRGLLPMLYSLIPQLVTTENTLVIMYSIHTPENWEERLDSGNNELWNAIQEFAGAVIVDKTGTGRLLQ